MAVEGAAAGVVAREDAWGEMREMKEALAMLESRLRFIREAGEGKIRVFALTHAQLLDSLAAAGYPPSARGGHEYLLSIDVSCMTLDGVQQLEREREDTLARIGVAKASAALYAREQLMARIGALEQKKLRFSDALGTLAQRKEAAEKHAAALQVEVKNKMAAVDAALTTREAELLLQVGRIEQTKKTQIAETGEGLQRKAKSITSCIEEIDLALAKPDPYDFLEAAASVEGNVEDFLLRCDRGFAAPDPSFQLRLDVDSQIAAIRHITMAEGPRGTHSAPHADAVGVDCLSLPRPARNGSKEEGAKAAQAGGAEGEGLASEEGREQLAGGEGSEGGEGGEGAERLSAGRARGAGGGRKQPLVEMTQIHTFSPGVSGRQRSSIITVSSTVTARAQDPSNSIIGGHRLRPGYSMGTEAVAQEGGGEGGGGWG